MKIAILLFTTLSLAACCAKAPIVLAKEVPKVQKKAVKKEEPKKEEKKVAVPSPSPTAKAEAAKK